ncbi:MAG: DEAD/DEAH box helicase family protein, partial [Bacteroidales bacterium]|nr:DEAD/DEAH box helicase family protein [Bacteroidales bacterium]
MEYRITQSRLLYVMTIDDRKHEGLLKIGEVFVDNDVADNPNVQSLEKAVRQELDKRSYMSGVNYNIDHVECTTYEQSTKSYKADDVYRTLTAMGVSSKALNRIGNEDADIWFYAEPFDQLASVKEAIRKIKSGHGAGYGAIKFRPEQEQAISETVKHFKKPKGKAFLWNAKMRFGKTLSGLEVAKQMDYKSTLIITHRPVVDKGWHDDFKKIFETKEALAASNLTPVYATRMSDDDATGGDFYQLTKDVDNGRKRLVFFVSMQYLRLSKFVGGKERNFDPLKKAIMEYDWDFVMVDEAHEGIEAA